MGCYLTAPLLDFLIYKMGTRVIVMGTRVIVRNRDSMLKCHDWEALLKQELWQFFYVHICPSVSWSILPHCLELFFFISSS